MFRPVGGRREVTSRFRLISATNRDLHAMAVKGLFRKDLLYRLQTTIIELPALRERKEDIKFLMFHYVHEICDQQGMETKGFVPEFLDVLEKYDWPGNVRELVNTLEHAVISGNSNPTLYPANLPSELRIRYIRRTAEEKQKEEQKAHGARPVVAVDNGTALLPDDLPPYREGREDVLRRFEAAYVTRLMNATRGDLNAGMAISGMMRTQLYALLKKHAVTRGPSDPSSPSL